MKAVILAGAATRTATFSLDNYNLKSLVPLLNKPIIVHLLITLKKSGIKKVAIISSDLSEIIKPVIREFVNDHKNGMHISYFEEKLPSGTAGCLRELKGFIDSSNFLVIKANVFIENINLSEIYAFHLSKKARGTMVATEECEDGLPIENIEVDSDGVARNYHIYHHSRNRRRILRPCELYVFNPCVLDSIPENSYVDIKEQLIPDLNSKGNHVYVYKTKGSIKKINTFHDYFQLHRELLFSNMNRQGAANTLGTQIMDRIWVGRNVKISPKSHLIGTVIIGDNCTIEDHAMIIGPTSINSGTYIGKDALIRESVIGEKVHLKNKSCVEFCIIGDNSLISEGDRVNTAVIMRDVSKKIGYLPLFNDGTKYYNKENNLLSSIFFRKLKSKIFFATKRLLDVLLSVSGLIVSMPLFILIAIIIKLNSPGPVIYWQRRCGKEGKEFKMFKFRSMIKDAENIHNQLIGKKDVDGPMFKMSNDPRVTRVGRFLRSTNLDELPQLFNVLMGDMSLIGPRPLIMEEMKYAPNWRDIRLKVKPGMTGLWQINGKTKVSFHDWISSDIKYVEKQCFLLDLNILFQTIRKTATI